MNTQINYLYRDACNYKNFNEIVVAGILKIEHLLPLLKDKTYFIPFEVGLIDLQPEVLTEYDHIWHEIEKLQITTDNPTLKINAEQLLRKFKFAFDNEWFEFTNRSGRKSL